MSTNDAHSTRTDTRFCPILGLAYFLMLRPISPELGLFRTSEFQTSLSTYILLRDRTYKFMPWGSTEILILLLVISIHMYWNSVRSKYALSIIFEYDMLTYLSNGLVNLVHQYKGGPLLDPGSMSWPRATLKLCAPGLVYTGSWTDTIHCHIAGCYSLALLKIGNTMIMKSDDVCGTQFWKIQIVLNYRKTNVVIPPILRLNIAYFAVAEGWLLLGIGWLVLFLPFKYKSLWKTLPFSLTIVTRSWSVR